MDIFQSIILSLIEGVTEFLPISSTGHLILVSKLLNISQNEFVKSFEIIIQLGAILAVGILYWKRLIKNIYIWKYILAAFIPTGVVGYVLYKFIKNYLLGNLNITLVMLFLGGILFIILEKKWLKKQSNIQTVKQLTIPKAIAIGIIQSFSTIPGVSRSAASIYGGIIIGLSRTDAVEFSFLLAIPTMLAATTLDLLKTGLIFTSHEWTILLIGFISSALTAGLVIKWFIKFVQNNTFIPFGIYRIVLSVIYFILVR